jgi:hypothetical protein
MSNEIRLSVTDEALVTSVRFGSEEKKLDPPVALIDLKFACYDADRVGQMCFQCCGRWWCVGCE